MVEKGVPLAHQLTWSHYTEILSLSNINEINYSINITEEYNLSVRELRERLKKRISNIIKKRNKTQTTSI